MTMHLSILIHDVSSNTLEASWVDDNGSRTKCRSYAAPQKTELLNDCGADVQRRIEQDGVISDDPAFPTVADYVNGVWSETVIDAWHIANQPDHAAEKATVLARVRELRDKILSRLNGIQQDIEWNRFKGAIADAQAVPQIDGIMAAKMALKEITTYSTVIAATSGTDTMAAVKARYAQLVATLYVASPYACTAFNGLDA